MTFQEFIHVDAAIYFCYSQSECLCSPINLPIKPAACLSVFSARVLIWTSLEYLIFFCLSLEVHPTHYLQRHSLPYMSLRSSFMFYDSCMDAHTYTFFTHSTLCHLLKAVGSGYGLSPPLCYHSPVPLLSVSQLGPLSCIWKPTEWVYVWGVQGKCQLTKALRYHEALSILSVFRVTLDSISYFVITVYRHFHCKISIF